MRYVYTKEWADNPTLHVWFAGDNNTNDLTLIDANMKPVNDSTARRLTQMMSRCNAEHERMFAGFWKTTFPDKVTL